MKLSLARGEDNVGHVAAETVIILREQWSSYEEFIPRVGEQLLGMLLERIIIKLLALYKLRYALDVERKEMTRFSLCKKPDIEYHKALEIIIY